MSLSDCSECWDTPCMCGHGYKDWSTIAIKRQIIMLKKVLKENEKKYREMEKERKETKK